MMTSSKIGSARLLATKRLRKILEFLANLPDETDARKALYFKLHYWGFFEPEIPLETVREWAQRIEEEDFGAEEEKEKKQKERLWTYWLLPLRNAVRIVWVSSDLRFRQWAIFRILEKFFLVGDPRVSTEPVLADSERFLRGLGPQPSPCEKALMLLVPHPGLTKICENSGCEDRYFWAVRQSQKFCSERCALPAVRLSKRMWWGAHGSDWRRTRKKKQQRRRNLRRAAGGQQPQGLE
jgi:hypothetical protein